MSGSKKMAIEKKSLRTLEKYSGGSPKEVEVENTSSVEGENQFKNEPSLE
jgi:hypothetical protein